MERILLLEREIVDLRRALQQKETELYEAKREHVLKNSHLEQNMNENYTKLPRWAIVRYSRQILLSDIGVNGQKKLLASKVLVVGAGGLGCPAAMYLAGAGIGDIGIVDYDTVDITNIHRQLLHYEYDESTSKTDSVARKLASINSKIKITRYNVQLDSKNAREIACKYDVVLDCTDNVPTRYLLNDLCVLTKIPLISGSALKMEGQLTMYGYRDKEKAAPYVDPCYRCVFPTPPPAEAVGSCSADGVSGPVPGVIGVLQALEAIKYLVGHSREKLLVGRLLLFDGEDVTFRTVKLRDRNPQCAVCSDTPSITELIDYERFCRSQAKEKDLDLHILPAANRIAALELSHELKADSKQRHLLVDVRKEAEFDMCRIDGAVNHSIEALRGEKFEKLLQDVRECSRVTFMCRRGNDSQIVAQKVLEAIEESHRGKVFDLIGGLHAWAKTVDSEFPVY